MTPALWLASRSPRRAALLATLGVDFSVLDVEVDETPLPGEAAAAYVCRLARAKALAGQLHAPSAAPVLAADTTVVLDGALLGKPGDAAEAQRMLRGLAGRWHEVLTGVALAHTRLEVTCVTTRVCFRALSDAEIACYIASGEPFDKAGAYAIQGLGAALVDRLEGSHANVVGLPLVETLILLRAAQVPTALDHIPDGAEAPSV
jgi:septum formation protein